MDFDISDENRRLLIDLLRNYGPNNMTDAQENFLEELSLALINCHIVGTTMHLNF